MKLPKIVLFLDMSGKVDRLLARGISKYSKIHGPWHFYCVKDSEVKILKQIPKGEIDGIVAYSSSRKVMENIQSLGVPSIIHGYNSVFPQIYCDNASIAEMAIRYFIDKGFNNLGYVGYKRKEWSKQRLIEFKKNASKHNTNAFTFELKNSSFSPADIWDLANWLETLPKPIAILACNDEKARDVVEACKSKEIKIPEEVSLLGVDNNEYTCELCDPTISSISLNFEKAGYIAAKMLDKMLKGGTTKKRIVVRPLEIVERISTETLAIEDQDVVKAIDFIKDSIKKTITVQDVVEATYCSRRMLEIKFKKFANTTIQNEIDKRKIFEFAKLLINSDLTISQISKLLSMRNSKHVSIKFQKYFGISPLRYRKENRFR